MSKEMKAVYKPYFFSIDGLRLLASVNIVLFHLERLGGLDNLQSHPVWLFRIIKGPAFHASLFFILAGFLFTVKYEPLAATFSTRTLLRGRFRDLYPLHFLTAMAMVPLTILTCTAVGGIDFGKLWYSIVVHLSLVWSAIPFWTYDLNTPSWALSAFFLCYLLFAPLLRRITAITSRRIVVALMLLCFVPGIVWSVIFVSFGSEEVYQFFHIFAPIRLFEFILGMLLARLYYLNNSKPRAFYIQDFPILNDVIILATLALIYLNLYWRKDASASVEWLLYHIGLTPLYVVLLYRLARGNGLFARVFATAFVRNLGKCGFYPYLIHIPLVSWVCWIAENGFGYRKFLHSPLNVAAFMVVLYGGSYLYWQRAKKKRKKTYRAE